MAWNIDTFTPSPSDGYSMISTPTYGTFDFHLQRVDHATNQARFYLIRGTSSQEVCSFLDWQPNGVKANPKVLHEALIQEFSEPEAEQGWIFALDIKQG